MVQKGTYTSEGIKAIADAVSVSHSLTQLSQRLGSRLQMERATSLLHQPRKRAMARLEA